MNARLAVLFALALLLAGCTATQPAAPPSSEEVPRAARAEQPPAVPLTLLPERPQPGRSVTVTYYPRAEEAGLASPDTLELVVRSEKPDYRVVPMQKRGARWTAQITPDAGARFLRLYVQSDSLKDQDGGSAGWGHLLYGSDGQPVRGAYTARADFYREHLGETLRRDSLMMAAYRQELTRFPDHLVAKAHLRALQAEKEGAQGGNALRQSVIAEIDSARHTGDAQKLREVQQAYYALGLRDQAQSVGATLIEVAPHGPEAEFAAFRRATADGMSAERAQRRTEAFVERFPQSFFEGGVYESLFRKYRGAGETQKMLRAGRRWIRTEAVHRARALSQVAQTMAGLGRYDDAVAYAERAVAAAPEAPRNYSFFKTAAGWAWAPAPLTPRERRAQARRQRGEQRDVLGRIYYRRQDYEKAAEVLARASEENPSNPALWAHLAQAYEKTNRPDSAHTAVENALRRRPLLRPARALFRRLYVQRHGSDDGLRDAVARLARGKLLRERIDRAAPPLALTRLGTPAAPGDSLRVGSLQGKVVVLDFWASWCGPCHEAFPHLQTAYDAYRDAPDVEFLAVNTSWSDTKARARQYIEEAGYTFPLYWDADGAVARTYGVNSIPTTVIIGKGGRVQYHDAGFGGPERYLENLTLRIDLLRGLEGGRRGTGEGASSR